jgi:hypothetical protein
MAAYGKTVWSWLSLLQPSVATMHRPDRARRIIQSRGDGDKQEFVAGESKA